MTHKPEQELSTELLVQMHKELIRIRQTEATLAERYKQQEMRTPVHFGIGQEAVAVGVCSALNNSDVVYSHHRSHNHFLAKGGSVYRLAAELFGRETGCSGGRGGSVHLTCRDKGFIASSAILGEAAAAATGSALSFKMDKSTQVAVAFFGDAMAEEGAFYECLNYSVLHKLPVLFVCENNGYATESPLSIRQSDKSSIIDRVSAFQLPVKKIDGNNVQQVYTTARDMIHAMREHGPGFIECETYRWLEHVGPYYDHEFERSYRSKEELKQWQQKCPLKISAQSLIEKQVASQTEISQWEASIQQEINNDIERAYQDPWPDPKNLLDNVY